MSEANDTPRHECLSLCRATFARTQLGSDRQVSLNCCRQGAFSLVEVLVAMAVLALMLILSFTLINSATQSTRSTERRIDSSEAIRQIFDRMADDLRSAVIEDPVTVIVGKSNTGDPATAINDSLAMLTLGRAAKADYSAAGYPRMSGVGYTIGHHEGDLLATGKPSSTPATLSLSRILGSAKWDDLLTGFLAELDDSIDAGIEDNANTRFAAHAFGPGVVRMALSIHAKDGGIYSTTSSQLPRLAMFPTGSSTRMANGDSTPLDMSAVEAITVALAVLDIKSLVLVGGELDTIAMNLPRPADGQLPFEAWNEGSPALEKAISGLSSPAASAARESLRFHQYTLPLHVK